MAIHRHHEPDSDQAKHMHDTDKPRFADLLSDVMAYYGKDATDFMLSIFWDSLKRFDIEDVSRAFTVHAQNPDSGQFAPKVADIMRMIEGSTQTQGMLAWSKVQKAIRSVGKMRSVAFDDPLIHAVIYDMGGWYALCSCNDEDLPFKARDFEKRYQGYRSSRELPEFQAYLVGGHEADNRLNGYAYKPAPVLIGNPEKAARFLEAGGNAPALRITDSKTALAGAMKRIAGGAP